MVHDEHVREYLRLWLAEGVGSVTFRRIVEKFGSAAEAAAASPHMLQQVEGVGPKTADAIRSVRDEDAESEIAEADRVGATILTDLSPQYPTALKNIYDYPAVLYVLGRLDPTDALAIGLVGSRRCTHYGMEQAGRFGQLLARAGFTVVSGGARGIDTAGHRGAISVQGRTVAVMGCGLSGMYPPENVSLFHQIVEGGHGAIVSELPMRTAVLPGNFPTRNRIISGMSLGVLVVEASRRSGSLITAREAAEQGREVFAIPGPVSSPLSQGANDLIRSGAILVQNLDDILEHLGQVGAKMAPEETPVPAIPPNLNPTESTLHALLTKGPLSLDDLVRQSKLPSAAVTAAMTMLVLKSAVSQQAGNMFALKRVAGSP
ncbi:MAG: DNA-processing protein DprA [Planctomycetaceae bacterium]|nr:DNA-processing protein DprA [Planctomycetaceae bacterium]